MSKVETATVAPLVTHDAKARKRQIHMNGYLWIGGIVIVLVVLLSVLAPYLGLANPNVQDVVNPLLALGSKGHPLGTDNVGRDMLSRVAYGGRTTLLSGVIASLISTVLGVLLGMSSGYWGKYIDISIMRSMDVLMSFPFILLAILIVAFSGSSTFHALLAISIANLPFFARVVRSEVIKIKSTEYIVAARLSGASDVWILRKHVFRNVLPYIYSTLFMNVGWMISQTAALSFLGFGTQPPTADWGSMLADAQSYMAIRPGVAMMPGIMIVIAVIGFNLFGIGLNTSLLKKARS